MFKSQEVEEKDNELKQLEEARKQLILRLCNTQKHAENTEQLMKKIEGDHKKAIKAIQGFMEREEQMRDTNARKERRILELEIELRKLLDSDDTKVRRNEHDLLLKDLDVRNVDSNENNSCKQVNIAIYLVCVRWFLHFRITKRGDTLFGEKHDRTARYIELFLLELLNLFNFSFFSFYSIATIIA